MSKRALITGINGMDGSYMADFLLGKGYTVYGMERRASARNRANTKHLEGDITFLTGDLTDQNSLLRVLRQSSPDEIYNGLGVLRILEAVREFDKSIRFYQASSSEMFGRMVENPANENTPFYPRSPYGVSKLYGHWITKNYRESYGMFNVSGILFNHEGERRGLEFVTRKISDGVAKIHLGLGDHISLGNLDAKRDWGYAPDYIEAIWLMLQQDSPSDYVVATGETHSIRDFLDAAFSCVGVSDWSMHVRQDPRFMRPAEVDVLRGDYSKAKEELGWSPKTNFQDLVKKMVLNDIKLLGGK